jgi:creatinine amidohydrolase
MAQKNLLKDMSWYEFRDRLAENPVILVVLGSQEEQGPQSPMGDHMITEKMAEMVAERTGAIAAPVMPYGHAENFRPFPGGVQLRAETMALLVEDICVSFLDHGLDHLVIFNGHTGNFPLINQATRKLRAERGVLIPCLNTWRLLTPAKRKEIWGDRAGSAIGHGGDPIASVYLHLFPDLVRRELYEDKPAKTALGLPTKSWNGVEFQGVEVPVPLNADDVRETGIMSGDPSQSTAEIGKQVTDYIVDFSVAFVDHFRGQDSRVTAKG